MGPAIPGSRGTVRIATMQRLRMLAPGVTQQGHMHLRRTVNEVKHWLRDTTHLQLLQVHEPVLASGQATAVLGSVKSATAALAAAGVPINLVVYYDDLEASVYREVVQLPVAAISLDFCGVPGAAHGCATAALIDELGFPKVRGREEFCWGVVHV